VRSSDVIGGRSWHTSDYDVVLGVAITTLGSRSAKGANLE